MILCVFPEPAPAIQSSFGKVEYLVQKNRIQEIQCAIEKLNGSVHLARTLSISRDTGEPRHHKFAAALAEYDLNVWVESTTLAKASSVATSLAFACISAGSRENSLSFAEEMSRMLG